MVNSTRSLYFWITMAVLFFVFLFLIRGILLPFVLGMMVAYFLDPAADRLERAGLPRGLATGLIIASFFVMIGLLALLVTPVLISQVSGLIAAVPDYITVAEHEYRPTIEAWLGVLPVDTKSIQGAATSASALLVKMAGDFIAGIFQSGAAFISLISLVLIAPVVAFYLLQDWDSMVARIDSWLPRQHAQTIRGQLAIIDRTLAGFLRGQLNVCILLSVYYVLTLTLLDLKFSTVIGIMTGFLVIVPYAGWFLCFITAVAVSFFQFETLTPTLLVVGVYMIGQAVESYFLTPKLVGSQVGLHPVWIIFGMLAGGALFGFVGVLLAVPVTAVAGVLLRFGLERYLSSRYYRGETTLPLLPPQ